MTTPATVTQNEETPAVQCYVTGVGWCWMRDGEIMEVIATEEESNEDDFSL